MIRAINDWTGSRYEKEVFGDGDDSLKWLMHGVVVPMALVAALVLTACATTSSLNSTTTSSPSPTNRSTTLCGVVARVDRLIVTRRAPGNQLRFTFPAVVTVTNAQSVRAVGRAACALPIMSHGIHCPIGSAVHYDLDFAVTGERSMHEKIIVVNPTGCQTVSGLGAVRTTVLHQGFYRILGLAMGLGVAGQPTFAGTGTSRTS